MSARVQPSREFTAVRRLSLVPNSWGTQGAKRVSRREAVWVKPRNEVLFTWARTAAEVERSLGPEVSEPSSSLKVAMRSASARVVFGHEASGSRTKSSKRL